MLKTAYLKYYIFNHFFNVRAGHFLIPLGKILNRMYIYKITMLADEQQQEET